MKTVILKNGTEELEALVNVTMYSIGTLGPVELYELVEICRQPGHKPWGDIGDSLKALGLLERDGRPHESIKNIVLSAAVGEGMQLHLVNPRE